MGDYIENADRLRYVNHSFRKIDAEQLITGKPVYTQDIAPAGCLQIKLLRSPYANAIIEEIDTSAAMKVPGVEAVFTFHDVDQNMPRFTEAGQTYPEPSPRDRLVLDRHMRHVGDIAGIVAADTVQNAEKAMKLIRVKYKVLEPVLDFHTALDNKVIVHPEENWEALSDVGADRKRNLCAHDACGEGDIEQALAQSDVVVDRVYHTKAVHQMYMEPLNAFCTKDAFGRLVIVSSTQIVFHVRRNVATALGIPSSKIRVIKPRIGGGFGAKQTSVCEVYPAFVTWKTGKPSQIVYTREECITAGSNRHEMEMHVRLGGMKDGTIKAIDLYTLSNTGAYGEHGPTTVGLSGHKSIPLYHTKVWRFCSDVVYTNYPSAGAYRGYGAPQGLFAVESAVNEFSHRIGMDPVDVRLMNITEEGEVMPAYYGQINTSSRLRECLLNTARMADWKERYPSWKVTGDDGVTRVHSLGLSLAMQGSAINNVDVGSATLKLEEGGSYTLLLGCADMGTGADTILSQIAAEVLECPMKKISVCGADTDLSPYDSGSYASSTTYLTGRAVMRAAKELRTNIIRIGAQLIGRPEKDCDFDGTKVYHAAPAESGTYTDEEVSLFDIAAKSTGGNNIPVVVTATNSSEISPPPYMAGIAELETDPETGESRCVNYYATVDCGTPVSPALARVQAEGGILQGIGMSLYEDINYSKDGSMVESSALQYKVPARPDIGNIHVDFAPSDEKSGPYGAKSIGEVVIDTPPAACADALYNACGAYFRTLPARAEDIAMAAADCGEP